jgi:nucleotide-binding universal stress UspA family protein
VEESGPGVVQSGFMTTIVEKRKLLVPLLDTPYDRSALEYAQVLGETIGAELVLLAVVPDADLVDSAEARLAAAASRASSNKLRVTTATRVGDATQTIAQTAQLMGVDAIVIASDRTSRLDAWLNDDPVADLMHVTATPVVVIPADGASPAHT